MKSRFFPIIIAVCSCLVMLTPSASAADAAAKTIAQSYKTTIEAAHLYQYDGPNSVVLRDFTGDKIPEMILYTEGSGSNTAAVQLWTSTGSQATKLNTLEASLTNGGFSLYINKNNNIVLYTHESTNSLERQKAEKYYFDGSNGLKLTETVEVKKRWDPNDSKMLNGVMLRGDHEITGTLNGNALTESQARSYFDSMGNDVSEVLLGDGKVNAKTFDIKGISRSAAMTYLKSIDSFFDVTSDQYYAAPVNWAVKNSITNGTSAYTFTPSSTCTNAQIITFLWRAEGSPDPVMSNPFSNVKSTDYFYKAALWAYRNGMISGNSFNASAACSRADTVTYMWKASGSPVAGNSTFTDVPGSASYAPAVKWAVEKGITGGTGNGQFSPGATCTRGQIVTFLYRWKVGQ